MKSLKIKRMFFAIGLLAMIAFFGCKKETTDPQQPAAATASASDGSGGNAAHGIGSAIPAYYDSVIFKIIFVEFPSSSEATLIAKNRSLNNIYQSDPGLPGGAPFISVIDAVPGDGMNPVWREIQITFNAGY